MKPKKEGSGRRFSLSRLFLGTLTRKTATFFLITILLIALSFSVIFYELSFLRSDLTSSSQRFGELTLNESRQSLEALGRKMIREKALDVADEVQIYIENRPNLNKSDIENDEGLKKIAVQPVGLTGYTAVHDRTGINYFHVNPKLVGYDLHNLAPKYPDFWKILEKSLSQEAEGYYDWPDPDNVVRKKYMACVHVKETDLILCATTYLEEFYSTLFVSEKTTRAYIDSANSELEAIISTYYVLSVIIFIALVSILLIIAVLGSRSMSMPIKELQNATSRLQKGDFSARVNIKTHDDIQELGDSFNKTADYLERIDLEKKQLDKAKTEFLSITSHELRSPMTPMKAQLQMLMRGYYGKMNPKQRDAMDIVLRNTERLDKIIVDFLEISRIEAARLKFRFIKADLSDHVKRLAAEMKNFLPEKNIIIELKISKLPIIEVDPDRTMQILRNLVNNAIKFSHPNGRVTIDVHTKDDYIQFSVQDSGIGISKVDQTRLFEPFFQVEHTFYREYGGTGLGLAICKGIVESQNGRIWLTSDPEKGSTFHFTIPFHPVKEIRPIKILFSQKEALGRKIMELFRDVLGPLGDDEFNEMYKEGITKENIFKYMGRIEDQGILSKKDAGTFKERINLIFKEEAEEERREKEKGKAGEIEKEISGIFE